jgi:frataxin-like iron-binding protein CyaY
MFCQSLKIIVMKKIIFLILVIKYMCVNSQQCLNFNSNNSDLPNNVTWGIYIDSLDQKWVASSSGVSQFKNGIWETFNSLNAGFPSDWIREITTTSNGDIWVASITSGVYRFNGSTWTFYNISNSNLSDNSIYDIYTDKNDKVWVATSSGLSKFDGSAWIKYNTSNVIGFPSPLIYDLDENLNSNLLISSGAQGSWQGGLGILKTANSTDVFRTPTYPIASNNLSSSLVDSSGNIWIGTDNGLSKYDVLGNSWITYNLSNSTLPSLTVTDIEIFYGDTSRVWISTNAGIASFNIIEQKWESVLNTSNSCLTINSINDIEIDSYGNVWATGIQGGLTIYNRYKVKGSVVTDIQDYHVTKNKVLQAYPNLTLGEFYLEIDGIKVITVLDNMSREVLKLPFSPSFKYDLSTLQPGNYFLKINRDTEEHTIKIVLKK